MTAPKSDDLLTDARQAYQAGDRARMHDLLKQAAAQDPNNFQVWLLATSTTDDKAQQRQFINRAKQLKRGNSRILMREKKLFPDVDNGFSFTPSPTSAVPVPAQPKNAAPLTPVDTPTDHQLWSESPPLRGQPTSGATAASLSGLTPADHIPTLADGVRHKTQRGPVLLAGLAVGLVLVAIILVMLPPGRPVDTPDAVMLRFYPAVQAGDNATLGTLLSDDAKALCGANLVQCIVAPVQQFSNFSIDGETITGPTATVKLQFHMAGRSDEQCQTTDITRSLCLYSTAYKAVSRWPKSFYEFLSKFLKRIGRAMSYEIHKDFSNLLDRPRMAESRIFACARSL